MHGVSKTLFGQSQNANQGIAKCVQRISFLSRLGGLNLSALLYADPPPRRHLNANPAPELHTSYIYREGGEMLRVVPAGHHLKSALGVWLIARSGGKLSRSAPAYRAAASRLRNYHPPRRTVWSRRRRHRRRRIA